MKLSALKEMQKINIYILIKSYYGGNNEKIHDIHSQAWKLSDIEKNNTQTWKVLK